MQEQGLSFSQLALDQGEREREILSQEAQNKFWDKKEISFDFL